MLEFNAAAFYQAISTIRRAQGMLAVMKEEPSEGFSMDAIVDGGPETGLLEHMAPLNEALRTLGAKMAKIMSDRIVKSVQGGALRWSELFEMMEGLDSRLRDELTLHTLFVLEDRHVGYYAPAEPLFGLDFETKFPSGAFELDEAAKCLALNRTTAAVFHLMRMMEIGLKATAACLAIAVPTRGGARNWGGMLGEIKTEIDRRDAAAPRIWATASDQDFFAETHASLDAVRVAWRNPTMHVEKMYSEEVAEHIYGAVRGFMRKLASRCDEDGNPRA